MDLWDDFLKFLLLECSQTVPGHTGIVSKAWVCHFGENERVCTESLLNIDIVRVDSQLSVREEPVHTWGGLSWYLKHEKCFQRNKLKSWRLPGSWLLLCSPVQREYSPDQPWWLENLQHYHIIESADITGWWILTLHSEADLSWVRLTHSIVGRAGVHSTVMSCDHAQGQTALMGTWPVTGGRYVATLLGPDHLGHGVAGHLALKTDLLSLLDSEWWGWGDNSGRYWNTTPMMYEC